MASLSTINEDFKKQIETTHDVGSSGNRESDKKIDHFSQKMKARLCKELVLNTRVIHIIDHFNKHTVPYYHGLFSTLLDAFGIGLRRLCPKMPPKLNPQCKRLFLEFASENTDLWDKKRSSFDFVRYPLLSKSFLYLSKYPQSVFCMIISSGMDINNPDLFRVFFLHAADLYESPEGSGLMMTIDSIRKALMFLNPSTIRFNLRYWDLRDEIKNIFDGYGGKIYLNGMWNIDPDKLIPFVNTWNTKIFALKVSKKLFLLREETIPLELEYCWVGFIRKNGLLRLLDRHKIDVLEVGCLKMSPSPDDSIFVFEMWNSDDDEDNDNEEDEAMKEEPSGGKIVEKEPIEGKIVEEESSENEAMEEESSENETMEEDEDMLPKNRTLECLKACFKFNEFHPFSEFRHCADFFLENNFKFTKLVLTVSGEVHYISYNTILSTLEDYGEIYKFKDRCGDLAQLICVCVNFTFYNYEKVEGDEDNEWADESFDPEWIDDLRDQCDLLRDAEYEIEHHWHRLKTRFFDGRFYLDVSVEILE